jgi:enolase-phosphatase E1
MIQAIVMDIEGTASPVDAVHEHLFPYSRARIASWLADHREDATTRAAVEDVRALIDRPEANERDIVSQLISWIDADIKAAPLKLLQGVIWHDGFQRGQLRAQVYPDVPGAIARWTAAGFALYSYSSGSVTAQRDWFAHTDQGDLTRYFRDHFDLVNAGPKQECSSYQVINSATGTSASSTAFLTDLSAELDAAAAAGWRSVGVHRPGRPKPTDDHRWISTFAELDPKELCVDD